MLLLVGAFALRAGSARPQGVAAVRWIWTIGCLVYVVHVICAFQFVHHWSHQAAYTATAQQTLESVGLDWGGGLFLNYAFTLVWLADVSWWWLSAKSFETRPALIEWIVDGFLAFMAFNATVVFANGFTRWTGLAACFLVSAVWARRRFFRKSDVPSDQPRLVH
jgi:hypothetical protein